MAPPELFRIATKSVTSPAARHGTLAARIFSFEFSHVATARVLSCGAADEVTAALKLESKTTSFTAINAQLKTSSIELQALRRVRPPVSVHGKY